jgi:uncharacterized membrane protein YtjA (UPF0391 family)
MKTFIGCAFVAALCCAILSYAGVLSANSIVPPVCFAVALILVLLQLMNVSDRRY